MQCILGHATFSMTADLYSHVLPDTKVKEMEKMEQIFEKEA
jgi:integrase